MTEKDRNLLAHFGLTCLLLITAVFLLKPAFFWQYQLFLIAGLGAGFAFGWYNRKGGFEGLKYIIDAAILITLAWMGWRIFKSTFLYKEVIGILIQGVIVLEVIFCFNFSAPGKIAYIRLLSLLIFMAFPVFAVVYSMPLAIAYLLGWLAVLRFQLASFNQPLRGKGLPGYYSLATSLVCFLVAMLLAWFISTNVYLGRINKGMLLLDEDMQNMGSGGKDVNQADKFYSLQDDLQNQISDLALKLDSYEKRRQLIYLLSELVKEQNRTLEVDKAQIGLIDILKREGAGLDGAQEAMDLAKQYLDKKNSRNLQKNKDAIMDKLRDQALGIVDKIKITSLANKLQQSSSYQQSTDNSQALQNTIQNAALSRDVQNDLAGLARSLANLKAFELYRRKVEDLEQRPAALGQELEKKIADIISDIKHTQGLDDFQQTAKKIRQLKNDPAVLGQLSAKSALKSLEEAAGMKLDLFLAEESEKLREAALRKQDLGAQTAEFDKKIDRVGNAKNLREFNKEFLELSQMSKDNNLGLAEGLGLILDLKTESFKQKEKEKLDSLAGKVISIVIKKEIMEAIEELEEKDNLRDLGGQYEELAGKVKELERKGELSAESAAALLKAVAQLKDLLESRLKGQAQLKKEEVLEKVSHKPDYLDQLQQAIEDSFLNSQQKQTLKDLLEQLLKAQNLSQLEDIREALEKEISSLGAKEKLSDKERAVLSAAVNNLSAQLEKKIDNLENAPSLQIEQLQESLKKMLQSQDNPQLQKAAEALKEKIKNTALNKQEQDSLIQAAQRLKETLEALLEKKTPTAVELKEINKINEKIKQAAQIKQQFLASKALAEILKEIEKLSSQDVKKAQALEEKLEQMRKSDSPEEVEKTILDLKNILNSESLQKNEDPKAKNENKQQWKVYILSSPLIVSPGTALLLKVIGVYKNEYIKELNSDVEWFLTDPQVAQVDDLNFLHPLAKGKTKMRVVYKGASSKDVEVNVVEDLDAQTVQKIKGELAQ